MSGKQDYIAVYDSGVGGISVLRQLIRYMPGEKYYYYGDSANAPYGSRPTWEVRELALRVVARIFAEKPCKALVIGCNTVTAAAVAELRSRYPEKIIVGIEPAVKLAADHFPGGRVGVMATPVTLREEKFDILVHRFEDGCTIEKIPGVGLVELVEQGKAEAPETQTLLEGILGPYRGKLDALVLGCTHYPFAAKAISRVLNVPLLDGGKGTARETLRRLAAEGLLEQGPGRVEIVNSKPDGDMVGLCRRLLEGARPETALGRNQDGQ